MGGLEKGKKKNGGEGFIQDLFVFGFGSWIFTEQARTEEMENEDETVRYWFRRR